ncbi:MAG: vitamin B12 dependent methionine synthase, partial [Planctomycetota bacterium]|nr:vitamin B12 dependent methionine synthase [Planctomycetota bacterium]
MAVGCFAGYRLLTTGYYLLMDAIILDNIPFEINTEDLLRRMRVAADSADAATIERMVEDAVALGRPKGIYGTAYIESRSDETVVIDGVTFASRVLRVNLDKPERVFPFLATCGAELQAWSEGFSDMLEYYWADVIKEMALRTASKAIIEHLKAHNNPGKMSSMSPGSLEDWPITEQEPMFNLLGSAAESIGVRLTDSFLMIPNKSLSGINFPT